MFILRNGIECAQEENEKINWIKNTMRVPYFKAKKQISVCPICGSKKVGIQTKRLKEININNTYLSSFCLYGKCSSCDSSFISDEFCQLLFNWYLDKVDLDRNNNIRMNEKAIKEKKNLKTEQIASIIGLVLSILIILVFIVFHASMNFLTAIILGGVFCFTLAISICGFIFNISPRRYFKKIENAIESWNDIVNNHQTDTLLFVSGTDEYRRIYNAIMDDRNLDDIMNE